MSAKILDFYRAKAKSLVNKQLKKYGALPGGCIHDLIFIVLRGEETTWKFAMEFVEVVKDEELNTIFNKLVENQTRLINALECLEKEYKLNHNNDIPYYSI